LCNVRALTWSQQRNCRAEIEAKLKKRKKKNAQASKLSFAEDLDEEEQGDAAEAGDGPSLLALSSVFSEPLKALEVRNRV
jgi:hypothetical protein